MAKITLTDVANLQNETTAVNAINNNNAVLEAASDNTLSRDGTSPNNMEANLDMDSNRIINLPAAVSSDEPVRKAEFDLISNGYTGNNVLLGTNNEITVSSGGGTTTFSLPNALTFTGKTITGGTYSGAGQYNKVTITPPATTATITLANNSTLTTLGNTILSGTNSGDVLTLPTGRLSLSSTSSLPTTDITAGTTLYYVDCGGGAIPIWDIASSTWIMRPFTGSLSIALDSNPAHTIYQSAGNCFDVYAFYDSSLGSVRLGITGTAGPDLSLRGTVVSGLVLKNGIWVNTLNGFLRVNNTGNTLGVDYIQPGVNAATYLGTIGTVLAGQVDDTVVKRLVFNAYNPKPRNMYKKFTGVAYAYNGAYRQVNADTTNQLEFIIGLEGILVDAFAQHNTVSSAAPGAFKTVIYDATTGLQLPNALAGSTGRNMDTTGSFPATFRWTGYPPLGRKTWYWMESWFAGTLTWQTESDISRNGIFATISGM